MACRNKGKAVFGRRPKLPSDSDRPPLRLDKLKFDLTTHHSTS